MNKQIIASPTDQVNALKDRQDLLLEKISLLTPIQATKESSGSVTVTISGITVVNQDRANLLDSNVSETGNLKMAGTGWKSTGRTGRRTPGADRFARFFGMGCSCLSGKTGRDEPVFAE